MKSLKKNGKLTIKVLCIILAVCMLMFFIVYKNFNSIKTNILNFNINGLEKNNANISVIQSIGNREIGDGTVTGEIVIGGAKSGLTVDGKNYAYADGNYRNGYCLDHGKNLYGTAYNKGRGNTLNFAGSSYSNSNNNCKSETSGDSIKWLLDNMLRMNLTMTLDEEYYAVSDEEYKIYKQNLKNIVEKYTSSRGNIVDNLTDTEIFQVQQYVLWHYTKNVSEVTPKWINNSSDPKTILYNALISGANDTPTPDNGRYSSNGTEVVTIVQNKNCTMEKYGNNSIIIGPITINNDYEKIYKFSYYGLQINNESLTTKSKIVQDDKKTEIERDSYTNYNGKIYVIISDYDLSKVNYDYSFKGYLTALSYKTTADYWYYNENVQPVVTLSQREPEEFEETIKANYKKTVNGKYDLEIEKQDTKGNTLSGSSFNIIRTDKPGLIKTETNDITINSEDEVHKYVIQETNAPTGYKTLANLVDVKVSFELANGEYKIKDAIVEGDTEGLVSCEIVNNKTKVKVVVKNKYFDLALKKMILSVTKAETNEEVEVKKSNGFNVSRHNENGVGWESPVKASTGTNSIYTLNKTPVEVSKGDKINYSIRIYNEGEVEAKAPQIYDYIPKGLKLVSISYQDGKNENGEIDEDKQIPVISKKFIDSKLDLLKYYEGLNYSIYDYDKGNLEINLTNTDYIRAVKTGAKLDYDYVTVTCIVEDTAKGILTNVAEITKYKINDGRGVYLKDIDSTANNWTARSQDKLESDKSNDNWNTYSNAQDNLLDGNWHTEFKAQDFSMFNTNGNKGDDDDFDKIVVKGDYNLKIRKVNSKTGEGIDDIKFNVSRQKTGETVEKLGESIETINAEISYSEELTTTKDFSIIYNIEEIQNDKYIQLAEPIKLELIAKKGLLSGYNFTCGDVKTSKPEKITKTFTCKTKQGENLNVKVNYPTTGNEVIIEIENAIIQDGQYGLRLRKISSGNNEPLTGVTFKVEQKIWNDNVQNTSIVDLNATDDDGYTNTYTDALDGSRKSLVQKINLGSLNQDIYKITEINLGENTGYTKLNSNIIVKVNKKIESENYVIDYYTVQVESVGSIKVNSINLTDTISITENGVKYLVTATMQNSGGSGILDLTITNAPDNNIPLQIRKVSTKTGETITGAEFVVTKRGAKKPLFNGIDTIGKITLTDNIEATTKKVTYDIEEVNAPEGFDNILYDKYIQLDVTIGETTVNGVTKGVPTDVVAKVYDNDGNEDTVLTSEISAKIVDVDSVKTIDLQISNPETKKVVDLALKKVITEIDGKQVNTANGYDAKYDRLTEGTDKVRINTQPLKNGKFNAEYYLNKTPVLVQKGSKVKYQIRIYNEGMEQDATASKIIDYLPVGLKFVKAYYRDEKAMLVPNTDYIYNSDKNVLEINVLENKELIKKYDGGDSISYDYITVECEVENNAEGILTNIAEISEYKTPEGIIESDRDSRPADWKNPVDGDSKNNENVNRESNYWINYSGRTNIEEGKFKDYKGQQDDDDFEKLVVGDIDLVLKKVITHVNNTSVDNLDEQYHRFQNGKIIVRTELFNISKKITTADYYMNKTPIQVSKDDNVTYQIRIYNEGDFNATASEITDYIPQGLDLVSVSYKGKTLTKGTDYTIDNNVLKVIAMKNNFINKYSGNSTNFVEPEYDYITVTCKVNGSVRGILTNVAEISKYQTPLGETTVDRDSQTNGDGEWKAPDGTDKNTLEGKSGANWAQYYSNITNGKFAEYPGQQDDDDFEKVIVKNGYKLKLQKISALDNSKGLANVDILVNGEKYTTNSEGNITNLGIYELNSANGLDEYKIEETSTNNNGYVKLAKPIWLYVHKAEQLDGNIKIDGYYINFNEGKAEGNLQQNKLATYKTVDENGRNVNVIIQILEDENTGDYTISIKLENNIDDSKYDVYIEKVDEGSSYISDVEFSVKEKTAYINATKKIISTSGKVKIDEVKVNDKNVNIKDTFEIEEVKVSDDYFALANSLKVTIGKKFKDNGVECEISNINLTCGNVAKQGSVAKNGKLEVILEGVKLKNTQDTVKIIATVTDGNSITLTIQNKQKEFDLALRKFITKVNGTKLSENASREPVVNIEKLNNQQATTAEYIHTKDALVVSKNDVVEYTIRIYNEGSKDGYANLIMDDVPEGLQMIAPGNGRNNTSKVNAEYNWKMYRKAKASEMSNKDIITYNQTKYIVTNITDEAELIVTNYLSKENGETIMKTSGLTGDNPNLLKAFIPQTSKKLDSKEVKVEFKVKDNNEPNKIITNYAQITDDTDKAGNSVEDRDSTPNKWEEAPRNDDQDIENIKLKEQVITGEYEWELEKQDSNGYKLNEGSKFTITRNGKAVKYNEEVKYSKLSETGVTISSDKDVHTYKIHEDSAKTGYKVLSGDVTFKVTFKKENDTYVIDTVTKEGDTENLVSYTIENNKTKIKFVVKNKYVDLALKKMITSVTKAGTDTKTEVKKSNGFNVSRYNENGVGWVNPVKQKTGTNATYTLNKTPVEVSKGDKVSYDIRVYNEGEVKAKANQIYDYIPNGLKPVSVLYQNNKELKLYDKASAEYNIAVKTGILKNKNYAVCDYINGNLKINLGEADYIENVKAGEILKFDYVTVTCEVLENATGVLTNVAEITKYKMDDGKGEFDKDIDSTAENWVAPNNENKYMSNKSSEKWNEYSNSQSSLLDENWHTTFKAQDAGLDGNKGDDDDFDKIVVRDSYNLTVRKINANNNQGIDDVEFNVSRVNADGTKENFENVKTNGSQFSYSQELSTINNYSIIYTLKEVNNSKYVQFDEPIVVKLNVEKGKIKSYDFICGTVKTANSCTTTKTFTCITKQGVKLKATIKFELGSNDVNIEIENKIVPDGKYALKLKKVSSDDNKPLAGVVFKGESEVYSNNTLSSSELAFDATNSEGYTNTVEQIINFDSLKSDTYKIKEIDLGANKGYSKMNSEISVTVNKVFNNEKFSVDSYNVQLGEDNSVKIDSDNTGANTLSVTENGVKYILTAQITDIDGIQTLVLTVTNAPDNNIPLQIRKVSKETGEVIKGTEFEITRNGVSEPLFKGISNSEIITLTDNVEAGNRTLTYIIEEVNPAEGFDNIFINGYIQLDVKITDGVPTEVSTKVFDNDGNENTSLESEVSAKIVRVNSVRTVDLQISNPETKKVVDLALKKVITEINDKEVNTTNGYDSKYDRLTKGVDKVRINTQPLKDGKNDAEYYLNKTPVIVQKGSKVKYQIRIYNESVEEDATASRIIDYLPAGMKLVNVYYQNENIPLNPNSDYSYDSSKNVVEINALNNKELISKFNVGQDNISYDYVTVECEVLDSASGILTNVAEITEYKTTKGIVESDRDSAPANWKNPVDKKVANNATVNRKSKYWINYSGKDTIQQGAYKNYRGQQDDDDFEKLVVAEIDLVLKKVITNVNDKSVNDMDEQYQRFQNGNINVDTKLFNKYSDITTANYYMNKTPIIVNVNDNVTYQIRIYNEGGFDATASEITDYIPQGLDLVSVSYKGVNLTEGTDYTISNNVLKVTAMKDNFINKYSGNSKNNISPNYDYITVTCKVNGNVKGILTNVAEISKYQTFLGETTVDKDSQTVNDGEWSEPEGSNKNTLEGKGVEEWAQYYSNIQQGIFAIYPGQQDDDDFEKIEVESEYSLTIKKINAKDKTGIDDIKFNISLRDTGNKVSSEKKNVETLNSQIQYNRKINATDNYSISYSIEEVENNKYVQLDNAIELKLNVEKGKIVSYNFECGKVSPATAFTDTQNFEITTSKGVKLNVKVNFNFGNNDITVEIENKIIPSEQYGLRLRKISSGNSEPLSGVTFSGESTVWSNNAQTTSALDLGVTDTNGYTKTVTQTIDFNSLKNDVYQIREIDLGGNTGYSKLDSQITVEVAKKLENDEFSVDYYNVQVENAGNIKIDKNNRKNTILVDKDKINYYVTAEMETVDGISTLTVTVTNAPDNNIPLQIIKVSKDDESETIQGTEYVIERNGLSKPLFEGIDGTGIVKLTDNVEAGNRTLTYIIEEVNSADGYDNTFHDRYIQLDVTIEETTVNGITKGVPTSASVKVYDNNGMEDTNLTSDVSASIIYANSVKTVELEIRNPKTERVVDLALKKVITEINGKEVKSSNGYDEKYDRLTEGTDKLRINTQPLKDGKNDAEYYLNKTPILVEKGSTVKYQLRIYNESMDRDGKIGQDATASKIIDYLPVGLKATNVYYRDEKTPLNANTDYIYDENNNVLEIMALNNKDLIKKYDGGDTISCDYITVECEVLDNASGILTNVAEIAIYKTEQGSVSEDRDSKPSNWKNPVNDVISDNKIVDKKSDKWVNYRGKAVLEEGKFKKYLGQEDDDDFEKLIVGDIDLVLKKVITSVNDQSVNDMYSKYQRFQNGEITVDATLFNNGNNVTTADYYMNKTPIEVKVNDIVTYQIRIYNEGKFDATASEITDYIPQGLELVFVSYKGVTLTEGADYIINNNVLKVDAMKNHLINKYSGSKTNAIPPEYDYITVTCRVNENAIGILTNVAEITQYQTALRKVTFDRDSQTIGDGEWKAPQGSNKNTLEGKGVDSWAQYYSNIQEGKFAVYPGQQDDDDFEKIVVKGEYNIKIRKINGTTKEGIDDIKFNIQMKGTDGISSFLRNVATQNSEISYTRDLTTIKDYSIKYTIEEIKNDKYVQLDNPVVLQLIVKKGKIVSYNFTCGNVTTSNPCTQSRTFTCTTKQGVKLKVEVDFEAGTNDINVIIENKIIPDAQYGLRLRKISSGNGSPLAGVTFGGESSVWNDGVENTSELNFTETDNNGYTNTLGQSVKLGSLQSDVYKINEINLGNNTGYTKLDSNITVTVGKKFENDTLMIDYYDIEVENGEHIRIDDNTQKDTVTIRENKVDFVLTAEKTVIDNVSTVTLTLTNAPDITIPLQITKLNKNDDSNVIKGTEFRIERLGTPSVVLYEDVDLTGTINLTDRIEAGDRTITYIIDEVNAAEGFENTFKDRYIQLNVTIVNGAPTNVVAKVCDNNGYEDVKLGEDISASFTIVNSVKTIDLEILNPESDKVIDLALKKIITEVDGKEVKASNGFDAQFDRLTEGNDKFRIDTQPLKEGRYDAKYYLNKTPITVRRGSKIKYQIRIYNEGEEDATAAKIKDYLPAGMKLVNVYYRDTTTPLKEDKVNYTYDTEHNVVIIGALGTLDKELIKKYDGGDTLSYDYVTVECRVGETAEGILTNVAEITQYKTRNINGYIVEIDSDRDSSPANWRNPVDGNPYNNDTVNRKANSWVNYRGRGVIEEGKFKVYRGLQDDDDFEKVVVGEIDLVLKKVITKVNDKSVNDLENGIYTRFIDNNDGNKEIKVDTELLNTIKDVTTADYYMNKTPVEVHINDKITYQIRIYNEGSFDATASEITDYIPKGLDLVSVSYKDKKLTEGTDYTINENVLKVTAMADNFIPKYSGNAGHYSIPEYDYITVTCKPNGTVKGLLTNVAEITEYQTSYERTTIDRDSQTFGEGRWKQLPGADKNTLDGKSGVNWARYYDNITSGKIAVYPGQQDDDDFEKILVTSGYSLQVQKISALDNSKGLQDVDIKVNDEKYTTDENGYIPKLENIKLQDTTGLDSYKIEEVDTGDNKYAKLKKPFYIFVEKEVQPDESINIKGYYINFEDAKTDGSAQYNNLDYPISTYHTLDESGRMIDVIIEVSDDTVNIGNYNIDIKLENNLANAKYDLYVEKVDEKGNFIENVKFKIDKSTYFDNSTTEFTTKNEKVKIGEFTINEQNISKEDVFFVNEIETPKDYYVLANELKLVVNKRFKEGASGFEISDMKLISGETEAEGTSEVVLEGVELKNTKDTVKIVAKLSGNTIVLTVQNKEKEFDLSLRKFITSVNGTTIDEEDSRKPVVNISKLAKEEATTAKYTHTKVPVEVHVQDVVEYTIRVYNEGTKEGYSELVMDNVPDGLQMVTPGDGTEGTSKINANYRWKMYKKLGNNEVTIFVDTISYAGYTYVLTENANEADVIVTDYLSKQNGEAMMNVLGVSGENPNLLKPFIPDESKELDYRDVKVEFRVDNTAKMNEVITNKAQVTEDADSYGNGIDDRDSTPNKWEDSPRDDDQDVENIIVVKVKKFDLSLRKFISSVNGNKLEGEESREPVVNASKLVSGESTTAEYTHTKEAKVVNPKDVVEYTLRVYNEGDIDGYATMVMDDVPNGVEVVAPVYDENGKADNLNAKYRWVMYKKYADCKDEDYGDINNVDNNVDNNADNNAVNKSEMIKYNNAWYVKTTNAEEAELVVTDYLSEAYGEEMMKNSEVEKNENTEDTDEYDEDGIYNPNLLKAFDYENGIFTEENYRDVKIEFKVKSTNEENKIITNYAQITKHLDLYGSSITDRDSTPNEWIEEDDDQDIENIKVRYFDLALYKWVSTAMVVDGDKITEYPSNHTQDDKSKVVNVAIPKDKLDKVTVKFKYQIKVENQGQLEGYAKEVKDHIPAGLKFIPEDNKKYGWVLNEKEGTITTDYLKDTLLKHGETAEVTVVLTWINDENNLGQKINYAEISKDYNMYGSPDIDSTPDNFIGKCIEDDEDSDAVMLQVRTGEVNVVVYAVLGVAVMTIIAGGVIGIKKFVM